MGGNMDKECTGWKVQEGERHQYFFRTCYWLHTHTNPDPPTTIYCVCFWFAAFPVWQDSGTVTRFSPEQVVDPVTVKSHYDQRSYESDWNAMNKKWNRDSAYKDSQPCVWERGFGIYTLSNLIEALILQPCRLLASLTSSFLFKRISIHGIWPVGEGRVIGSSCRTWEDSDCWKGEYWGWDWRLLDCKHSWIMFIANLRIKWGIAHSLRVWISIIPDLAEDSTDVYTYFSYGHFPYMVCSHFTAGFHSLPDKKHKTRSILTLILQHRS